MKKSRFMFLSVLLGISVLVTLMVMPVMAEESVNKENEETLYSWIQTLPQETQAQIDEVLKMNEESFTSEKGFSNPSQFYQSIMGGLQDILTRKQFKKFKKLVFDSSIKAKRDELSRTASTCSECYWLGSLYLSNAYNYIQSAISNLDPEECNCTTTAAQNISLSLALARYDINRALNAADLAYSTCDCDSANDSLSYANQASSHISTALWNTQYFCDPDCDWTIYANGAQNMIDDAADDFADCIAQACN